MIFGALLLALFLPQTLPVNSTPSSNAFLTAAETAIDDAAAVDLHASDDVFSAQMQQMKMAQENLKNMASSSDRDHEIVNAVGDVAFALNTCHIQLKNSAAPGCEARIAAARNNAMHAMRKHREGGHWVDGPPA